MPIGIKIDSHFNITIYQQQKNKGISPHASSFCYIYKKDPQDQTNLWTYQIYQSTHLTCSMFTKGLLKCGLPLSLLMSISVEYWPEKNNFTYTE